MVNAMWTPAAHNALLQCGQHLLLEIRALHEPSEADLPQVLGFVAALAGVHRQIERLQRVIGLDDIDAAIGELDFSSGASETRRSPQAVRSMARIVRYLRGRHSSRVRPSVAHPLLALSTFCLTMAVKAPTPRAIGDVLAALNELVLGLGDRLEGLRPVPPPQPPRHVRPPFVGEA